MIDQEQLKKVLNCDLESGLFSASVSTNRRVKVGQVAGHLNNNGYIQIGINGTSYLAHRLVWLYAHGSFPIKELDHINGVKSDNRLCNLREATSSENGHNKGKYSNNTSGFKGVSWYKRHSKWRAQCSANGNKKTIGYYDTAELAAEAYQAFAKENHGKFYCGDAL